MRKMDAMSLTLSGHKKLGNGFLKKQSQIQLGTSIHGSILRPQHLIYKNLKTLALIKN